MRNFVQFLRWAPRFSLLFGLACPGTTGAAPAPITIKEPELPRLPGVFNTELPQTLSEGILRFSYRPHFGDLVNRDHLRNTFGLRYGITEKWECNGELDAYFSHGIKDVSFFDAYGLSTVRFGTKYQFSHFLRPFWIAGMGVNYSLPIGRPPPETTDGLEHIAPYITLAHTFERNPNLTGFLGFGVDVVTVKKPGSRDARALAEDSWNVTPGIILHRGAFRYSLEATYTSTAGIGNRSDYRAELRPAVAWIVPPKYKFNVRSRWIIGLGLRASYGTDGSDFGASVKLQSDIDFLKFVGWKK